MAEIASPLTLAQPSLGIEPLGLYLGAQLTGIDHTTPLDDETVRRVSAIRIRQVLVGSSGYLHLKVNDITCAGIHRRERNRLRRR